MRYIGEFTSLAGKDYSITIRTQTAGSDQTILLSGVPFTTSVDEGDGGLYAPIRCGGATVGLLTKSVMPDLYSGHAKGVRVDVVCTSQGRTVWSGFVSPTMYDQGYDGELEELQLDCVDGIAVLKNIPYRSPQKAQLSLLDFIRKCLREAEVFSTLYISTNVQMAASGTEETCSLLRISENCFFADRDDPSQPEDEVAWSCYEVLEEIMRWLGLTLIAEGDTVYCVDYDAMKTNPSYWVYNLSNDSANGQLVTYTPRIAITGDSYGESGTRVSLDKVYNKVTVSDDFRAMKTLFPTFGDEAFEENITAASDPVLEGELDGNGKYGNPVTVVQQVDGKQATFQAFIVGAPVGSRIQNYVVIVKFMRSDVFRFHRYRGTGANKSDYTDQFEREACWGNMMKSYGAAYVRLYQKEITGAQVLILETMLRSASTPQEKWQQYLEFLNFRVGEDIKFEPMIIFYNPKDGHIGPTAFGRTRRFDAVLGQGDDLEDCQKYPCVTLRSGLPSGIFGGENSYLAIKGTYSQHATREVPIPLDTKDNGKLEREGDFKNADELYFWAKIRWGDRWLRAPGELTSGGWTPAESFFKLWWKKDGEVSVRDYYAREYPLEDRTLLDYPSAEKAVFIPAPRNSNLSGEPYFALYMNRDSRGRSKHGAWNGDTTDGVKGNYYTRYYNEVQILRSFSIETRTNAGGALNESDLLTDTVYTNETDNGSVEEFGEIKFKVCTYDGKAPSYSTVDYLGDRNESRYADRLYNRALYIKQGAIPMRQEEQMVWKCVTQYENPRLVFEATLKNTLGPTLLHTMTAVGFPGKTFVGIALERDWRMETARVTLLEKA